MATHHSDTLFLQYTTLDTLPRSATLTGTVSAPAGSKSINGTGTLFSTEIGYTGDDLTKKSTLPLGYLWNGSDEWREITFVDSDNLLWIRNGFTNALGGNAVKVIPLSHMKQASYVAIAAGGKVDGKTLVDSESGGWSVNNVLSKPITPHIIDGSTGQIDVNISYT